MLEPVNPLTMLDAQFLGGPDGVLQLLGGPGVHFGRVPVAPNVGRQDGLVPGVDVVQHGLADQVAADGEHLQVVLLQDRPLLGAVVVLVEGLIDFEVIAPAGQLQSIVAETAAFAGQLGQGQVGPLAGEHRNRSRHVRLLLE